MLYPRYKYDLPILALDLVVVPGGRISLAIIDACPVSRNKMLPQHYMQVWKCGVGCRVREQAAAARGQGVGCCGRFSPSPLNCRFLHHAQLLLQTLCCTHSRTSILG